MESQAAIFVLIFFLAVLGACVGSFLNVVIYRLPAGESLWWPGSHCPKCSAGLKWFENVPIFGWLFLRGKCRHCGLPISAQYPLIEALCAFLFVILYYTYYHTWLNESFAIWHEARTWPVYAVHLVLVAGLLAATIIDAKHYIIPLSIPWITTLIAALALPVYAHQFPRAATASSDPLVPVATTAVVHLAFGGMIGLGVALLLLALKLLPRSFDDEEAEALDAVSAAESAGDQQQASATPQPPEPPTTPPGAPDQTPVAGLRAVRLPGSEARNWAGPLDAVHAIRQAEDTTDQPATPTDADADAAEREAAPERRIDAFLEYSHPRREVLKESLFVAIPTILALVVWWYLGDEPMVRPEYPVAVRVLGGVCCGYLVGGGLVWFTRILGTLAFGREAMGLGDVHLLAAIGAVLGAKSAVIVFFAAPFLGLAYVIVAVGVGRVVRGQVRIIPFGPYLAIAALVLMLEHEPIMELLLEYFLV